MELKPKGVNREVAIIIASVFLYFTALGGIGSIISRFSRELGAGTLETGLIFSIGPMLGVLTRIPSGLMADKYGSKYFMMAGSAVVTVSALYASTIHDYTGVYVVRALQGLSMGLFISASIAAISIYGYIKYLTQLLSYRAAVISLSALVGPPLTTFLVDNLGYREAFYAMALFGGAALIFSILLPPKTARITRRSEKRFSEVIRNRIVSTLLILPLINGGVFFAMNSLLQDHVYTINQPSMVIGRALFLTGLIGLATRLYAVKLIEKMGSVNTLATGVLIEAIGMSILTQYNGYEPILYIAASLFGGGIGLTVPSGQYILLSNVAEDTKNTASAVYATGFDIGGTAGVIGFTYIASVSSFNNAYLAMAFALYSAAAMLYILLKRVCRSR